MVLIQDLVKTYGLEDNSGNIVEALKGIDLHIKKGEIFGIIGLSGAGKSSLVRCINLLEQPTSGSIKIDGKDIVGFSKTELRSARKKIGMVFQHFNLLSNSTVYDNIAFPLQINKKTKDFIEKRVDELLELVGLTDKKNMYPSMLSGGQKQRVGIARALANEPSIIMCDEATSALDPETTKSILNLLKDINKKLNMTIIIITHEMDVIKNICNKIAILDKGKIAEAGKVSDIFINPQTDVAKSFFSAVDINLDNKIYQKALEALDGRGVVIKAIFTGESTTDPYMSNIIKKFNIELSILLGNIQDMDSTLVGTLVLKLTGNSENVLNAIEYLKQHDVIIEEVTSC
ncbi:MAG: ATP-binding cassette domain-containing protein [bacterium]